VKDGVGLLTLDIAEQQEATFLAESMRVQWAMRMLGDATISTAFARHA
jgi:hypothetical protein